MECGWRVVQPVRVAGSCSVLTRRCPFKKALLLSWVGSEHRGAKLKHSNNSKNQQENVM